MCSPDTKHFQNKKNVIPQVVFTDFKSLLLLSFIAVCFLDFTPLKLTQLTNSRVFEPDSPSVFIVPYLEYCVRNQEADAWLRGCL